MTYAAKIKNNIHHKNEQGKYSLFSTDVAKAAYENSLMDVYYDILKEWDDVCNLPIEIGEFINNELKNRNYLIAFSRMYIEGLDRNGDEVFDEINDIAKDGLINNGHVNSSGAVQELNSPSDCLTPLVGIEGWINLVGSYKKNNAIVIYSLPKACVDNECHIKHPGRAEMIYNFIDNKTYIKPELLVGMIIKNKGISDIFLTRDDMLKLENKKTR